MVSFYDAASFVGATSTLRSGLQYYESTGGVFDRVTFSAAIADGYGLDNITLESQVIIPEPCTFVVWSLLAALGIGTAAYRRKR